MVTAWIPAQAIPIEMGPLTFAKPLEIYKIVENIEFNEFDTSYDKKIIDIFKKEQVSIVEEPFELGEVSFHHNLSFHTASENKTTQSRIVLANTYFAAGARVVNNPTMMNGGVGGQVEIYNWDGNLLWEYILSDTDYQHHHDIEPLPNRNILVIAWERAYSSEWSELGRTSVNN